MRANVGFESRDGDWDRVSGAMPCPICGGRDDCRTHVEEAFACCVQEPSDWRLSNGGWLHRIEPVENITNSLVRRTGDRRLADVSLVGVIS
jgi:hypothetical protein